MILRRLDFPGTAGMIFRRVYDDLKRNHIDRILDEFPGLAKYYSISNHEIVLPTTPTKSRIVFGYAETESELKRKFWGQEYQDIFVDQGEQLTENEHRLLKTSNRWPGMPDYTCKYVVYFNPGGIGIDFLKRVFYEKKYKESESADDFNFIQAYGWDNVEWVRQALYEDYPPEKIDHFRGCTYPKTDCRCPEKIYYSWDGAVGGKRFQYFITRSQYGRDLNALPESLRIGHLLGSLDKFAGQYFDNFDEGVHTLYGVQLEMKEWHPRWMSIDWGYAHDSACYWHSQDGPVSKTYRELVINNKGPRELARLLVEPTLKYREKLDAVYLSPDAFAKRTSEDTIAEQIGDEFYKAGLPRPMPADDDRVGGWMLMRELLEYRQWVISKDCPKLIRNLPMMSRDIDGNKPEDCIKFTGDDPSDSARYGMKSRHSGGRPPLDEIVMERLRALAEKQIVPAEDVHTRFLLYQKMMNEEKKKVGPITSWHRRRSFSRFSLH